MEHLEIQMIIRIFAQVFAVEYVSFLLIAVLLHLISKKLLRLIYHAEEKFVKRPHWMTYFI